MAAKQIVNEKGWRKGDRLMNRKSGEVMVVTAVYRSWVRGTVDGKIRDALCSGPWTRPSEVAF